MQEYEFSWMEVRVDIQVDGSVGIMMGMFSALDVYM